MTEIQLTPADRSKLRIFRQVAADARAAIRRTADAQETMRIVDGYIESDGGADRTRDMCIPVRRAYLSSDPINMRRIIDLVRSAGSPEIHARLAEFERHYAPIQEELDSSSILNDRRVPHAEMFEAWIDSVVFHDIPAKRQPFLTMVQELGRVVEAIGLHLAERIAERLLELDDLVADFLGQPRGSASGSEA